MRIAFDAKWFHHGPPSGRRVVRSLVNELTDQCDDPRQLAFVLRRPSGAFEDATFCRHDTVVCRGPAHGWQNAMRGGQWLKALEADVGFFQNFVPLDRSVPAVAHVHDVLFLTNPEYYSWREKLYLRPIAWTARRATRVVTVSHAERDRILSLGIAREPLVSVVHHGVSKRFRPLEAWPEGHPALNRMRRTLPSEYVLYCGRVNARKNVASLMKAMRCLGQEAPPLVLAGGADWLGEDLRGLRAQLSKQGRLIELGSVDDDDLAATYALASVFCFPSWEEAFGLPNLEAMASGTPVVASDIAAHREVCAGAATLVDPADVEAIAEGLRTLLVDQSLRADRRALGLARASQFRWDRAARELVEILRDECR